MRQHRGRWWVGGWCWGMGGVSPLTPFTAVQWQELEKQTMIYKYLMAGLPVPPDLVRPIPRRSDELSARFAPHSEQFWGVNYTLLLRIFEDVGCLSYYGKKYDPEPGRCRRTDGKKWRCSKAAYSESKYCERHMYRSKNRSRKPVESQPTSQSLSTERCSSSRSSQDMPLCSVSSEESSFWSNVTKLQMGPVSYGIDHSESSYFMPTPDPDELSLSQEASTRVGRLGLCSTSSIQDSFSSLLPNSSAEQYMPRGFEPINGSFSNQRQHNFFESDAASPPPAAKQGQNPVHLFFSEWPATRESWSNLDDDRSNHNVSSSTQLSISIPRASSDLSSGIAYSKNDESSKRFI